MPNASISLKPKASTVPEPSPDVTEYHVGWICSSTKEFLAALKIVDESRDDKQRPGYKLVRIQEHNVVINKPYSDSTLDFRARAVATDMKKSFPWIRFVLAVGIASSTPKSKEKVQLGDVVVGTNIASYGGDSASTTAPDRRQSPTKTLLLAGIAEMKIRIEQARIEQGLDIRDFIEEIIRNTKVTVGCSRRPENPDLSQGHRRFDSRPNHIHTSTQPVRIHYGPVAPVQSVTETTQMGSQITVENSVLRFDMGSADLLAAGIDCLSFCGISDYAQSQEGDAQHDYAALAAAVCAREFLTCIHCETVVQIKVTVSQKQMEDIMDGVVKRLQRVTGGNKVKETTAAVEDAHRKIDLLYEFVEDLPEMAKKRVEDVQNCLQYMKDVEARLDGTLKELSSRISRQEELAPDYATKEELRGLRQMVDTNRSRLERLSKKAENILGMSSDILGDVAQTTGIANVEEAAKWTAFAQRQTSMLPKLADFKPSGLWRPSKGNARQSSTANDSGPMSPQAGPPTQLDPTPENKDRLFRKPKELLTGIYRRSPTCGSATSQDQDNATTDLSDLPGGSNQSQNQSETRRPTPAPVQTNHVGDGASERSLSSIVSPSHSGHSSIFSNAATVGSRETMSTSPDVPPLPRVLLSSPSQAFNDQPSPSPSRDSPDSGVDTRSNGDVKSIAAKFEASMGKLPLHRPKRHD
ncbi:uncharacterized protein CDV56_103024 [Aspergillus thermomutatus]|uniref:Nucleoside phosphorylase domain-containing protein n=1 Tax=Aspergillus thermomutatus TaxID=41047 RepID=A0A397H827_ASPTH|nr:uncharacterized protein CDV56_103024 [Aspergillus thermomutatus]RHZ59245.1 hypothetical protein CDV56_103024 [Aspergillus thermomutatus]